MARLIQFLILFFFVRAVWRTLQQLLGGRSPAAEVPPGPPGAGPIHRGQMVKDPVCGLYLPLDRSLTETAQGKRLHFCSERCRQLYRSGSPTGDSVNSSV